MGAFKIHDMSSGLVSSKDRDLTQNPMSILNVALQSLILNVAHMVYSMRLQLPDE